MRVPIRLHVKKRELADLGAGLAFASPWLIGLVAFMIYPIAASFYYSFHQYDVVRRPIFVGLANYSDMIGSDRTFRLVLGNTLFMVVFGVSAGVVTAFLLAALLNNDMRLRPLFRTIFFLPSIVPAVAAAEIWRWIYNPQWGLINSVVKAQGLPIIPFLSSEALAKPSLVAINCWAQGTAIVIFLAALQDVPESLYDAARVDGANAWHRFVHVTIPLCTPSILFVVLTGLIGAFQSFTLAWLLTGGGPNQATEFYAIYLYRNAFLYFKMGYASALAWLLFLLIALVSIVIMRTSSLWVHYGGEVK